jgi:hypothetical protein
MDKGVGRAQIEAIIEEGKTISVRVMRKQKKWTKFDSLIGRNREYQTGYAEWFAM